MFSYCVDPKTLEGLMWLSCYVTTAKHMSFYFSFLVVMGLLSLAAPLAMAFGFAGATASRSSFKIIRSLGKSVSCDDKRYSRYCFLFIYSNST